MLRPNFEDPFDTAQQLVDNNITLYDVPGAEIRKQFLANSPIPSYNKLAETMIFTNSWAEYFQYAEQNVIGNGTHAKMAFKVYPLELQYGTWHRSQERVSGNNPFGGYVSNKKWYLNEVV